MTNFNLEELAREKIAELGGLIVKFRKNSHPIFTVKRPDGNTFVLVVSATCSDCRAPKNVVAEIKRQFGLTQQKREPTPKLPQQRPLKVKREKGRPFQSRPMAAAVQTAKPDWREALVGLMQTGIAEIGGFEKGGM
jgi:dTDP-4-dehydrorhamnose reductase